MKKTISFSLEEDIIQKIEQYQKQNNLSSKSAALERIVLGFGSNTNTNNNFDISVIKDIVKQMLNENSVTIDNNNIDETINEKARKIKNNNVGNSAKNSFSNMPE